MSPRAGCSIQGKDSSFQAKEWVFTGTNQVKLEKSKFVQARVEQRRRYHEFGP